MDGSLVKIGEGPETAKIGQWHSKVIKKTSDFFSLFWCEVSPVLPPPKSEIPYPIFWIIAMHNFWHQFATFYRYGIGTAQDVPYDLIVWYVLKTIYLL